MSIDAVIEAIRHDEHKHVLWLRRRTPDGIAGSRELHITTNNEYIPQVGDEIWGNAHACCINGREYRRIMRMWDGTEEVL